MLTVFRAASIFVRADLAEVFVELPSTEELKLRAARVMDVPLTSIVCDASVLIVALTLSGVAFTILIPLNSALVTIESI